MTHGKQNWVAIGSGISAPRIRIEGSELTGAVSYDGDAEWRDGDVAGRQRRVGEVATLLIVVPDVERRQLREVDAQRAAAVVDVRAVQRLRHAPHQ